MVWPGARRAVDAERYGASVFCTGEFVDANAYVGATEMALSASRAHVGPAIAYAFARSPFVHASAARHLDRLAPGRVFLGLGSGSRRMNESWFGVDFDEPVARITELVRAIRAWLSAENDGVVHHGGRFYNIEGRIGAPVLGPIDVPIMLGAFNRRMVRAAGAVADGMIGHPLLTDRWWSEVVEPSLGEAHAERSAMTSFRRWRWITVAAADDPDAARRHARLQIAFYFTVRPYRSLAHFHGWDDSVAEITAAFRARDPEGMAAAVDDEMLDQCAVVGRPDEVAERLRQRHHGDVAILAPPAFLVGRTQRDAYLDGIVDVASAVWTDDRS